MLNCVINANKKPDVYNLMHRDVLKQCRMSKGHQLVVGSYKCSSAEQYTKYNSILTAIDRKV